MEFEKRMANTIFYACSRDEIKRTYILAQLFEMYVCESCVYIERALDEATVPEIREPLFLYPNIIVFGLVDTHF